MNFFDVEECYHFVNFDGGGLNSAYISKSTGKTYLFSDDSDWADNKEELLEDIDCDDDYVAVPTQRELNLTSPDLGVCQQRDPWVGGKSS